MFLARKFSPAKWAPKKGLPKNGIPADAVTGDLRTQENTLSFWRCDVRDVDEAALAIAAGADRIDKLDIVWIGDDDLRGDGHILSDSPGRTPVADLSDRHVDLRGLDYDLLGSVARRVAAAIDCDHCQRLTKTRVKALLKTAARDGRIDLEGLSKKIREEIAP